MAWSRGERINLMGQAAATVHDAGEEFQRETMF